jgi:hypothetical protein
MTGEHCATIPLHGDQLSVYTSSVHTKASLVVRDVKLSAMPSYKNVRVPHVFAASSHLADQTSDMMLNGAFSSRSALAKVLILSSTLISLVFKNAMPSQPRIQSLSRFC